MIHLDFETYSELNVKDVGAYRYAEHESTDVLMAGWALDNGPVELWLPWCQPMPQRLAERVDAGEEIGAHNAQFERAVWELCLRRRYQRVPATRITQYVCTAVLAAAAGLPRSLEMAAKAAGIKQQKDMEGEKLKKLFCFPRKPTKADPRTRIMPRDAWDQFKRFGEYCKQDVRTERDIHHTLPPLHVTDARMYTFDLRMNERGIPIDIGTVRSANVIVGELERRVRRRVERATRGIRPTQVQKFKAWLATKGLDLPNLQKDTIEAVLSAPGYADVLDRHVSGIAGPTLRQIVEQRIEAGKASTKKLGRMLVATCNDGRARGMFLYHGAHTGRWAGKIIQPHNFIRGEKKVKVIEGIFTMLQRADADLFEALYDDPINAISRCMRGFIAALPPDELHVADYAAIEARVLAWLADEEWILRAYAQGYDVYKVMASWIFGVTYEQVDDEQRRIGKNAILGCGYGLGVEKFVAYCAKAGVIIDITFSQRVIYTYRNRHKRIMQYHRDVERAAIRAVREDRDAANAIVVGKVAFYMERRWLCILLPSGRVLRYLDPRIIMIDRWNDGNRSPQLSYRVELNRHLVYESTYGGKFVENITQAVAFDIMCEGMVRADRYSPVIGTVHDEILTERKGGGGNIKQLEHDICQIRPWAKGIPLTAEGFVCQPRYRKG